MREGKDRATTTIGASTFRDSKGKRAVHSMAVFFWVSRALTWESESTSAFRPRSVRILRADIQPRPSKQVIGNKWDMYLDLLRADYLERYARIIRTRGAHGSRIHI